jgi:cysteine synthase
MPICVNIRPRPLMPGMTVVEATGGNTGIGLAGDAVAKAKEIAEDTPGSVLIDQFCNPANRDIHH